MIFSLSGGFVLYLTFLSSWSQLYNLSINLKEVSEIMLAAL